MKKILFLPVFALLSAFLTLESCKKTEAVDASNTPKEQFYDGDEYDRGLVVEEPESELEDIVDYDTDATVKIDSIKTQGDVRYTDLYTDATCNTFKYDGYSLMSDNESAFRFSIYLNNETDSIIDVTADKNTKIETLNGVKKIERFPDNKKRWAVYCQTDNAIAITKQNIKFSITLATGKVKTKTVKCIGVTSNISENDGNDDNEYYQYCYGTSKYTAVVERRKLNKIGLGRSSQRQDINSSYIPQLGDVLYFGEKPAIITVAPTLKAATRTKPAAYKFRIVESNARCNNKRYIKSVSMAANAQILSTDGTTLATKFFRN